MTVIPYPIASRPLLAHPEASANTLRDHWCAYQHRLTLAPGEPPQIIFASICKINDLFMMHDARANSEWSRLTSNGNAPVMIEILAVASDATEARNFILQYLRTLPEWPHCNKHGYNLDRASRRLQCSDGRQFNSAQDAAQALGVTPSSISQHLRGKLKAVKGLYLSYVTPSPESDA